MIGLLILTFLTFISLGLGDSLLGSAWPAMYAQFGVDASAAGALGLLISGSTIVATYLSARTVRRFGTGKVLAVGLTLIALAIFGISFAGISGSFLLLCLLAIPFGFGVGTVDAGGNGFVAMHCSAKHMSWLHCFWGVGATAGPAIMVLSLMHLGGWAMGYRVVGTVQLTVAVVLFACLSRWRMALPVSEGSPVADAANQAKDPLGTSALLRLRGARLSILLFFVTGGLEMTLGLWGSTYLVLARGVSRETAASWLALYYLGLTVGRFLFGFLATRLHSRSIIRIGQGMVAAGVVVVALPFAQTLMPGFILIGLGLAPLFPNYVHNTPKLFGKQHTQAMIGLQVGGTHLGVMLLPPLFGLIGVRFGYDMFPVFAGVLLAVTILVAAVLFSRLPGKEA